MSEYCTEFTLLEPDSSYIRICVQAAWLLRAVSCIDLTTLAGDDTPANTARLALKAARPIRADLLQV